MLITGIGSLPFTKIEEALEYSCNHDLPFLPQLPQLNEDEMMVTQSLDETFGSYACFEPFLSMAINKKIKKVKLQLAGPITCSLISGKPIKDVLNILIRKSEKMIERFLERQIEVIFFIDEPMLLACPDKTMHESLREYIVFFKSKNIQVGLHCCSNPKWEPILGLGFDYLSFDILLGYADLVKSGLISAFTKNGGKVILGFDPRHTQKVRDIDFSVADYISYSCGMGTLSIEETYEILGNLKTINF